MTGPMVTIRVDARDVKGRFERMPKDVHDRLLAAISADAIGLAEYIKGQKLSGQVLKAGPDARLRESIEPFVIDGTNIIRGGAISTGDLPYAAIQEYGGEVFPTVAKWLHYFIDGKEFFSKYVRIPERSYLRSSLRDLKGKITNDLVEAVRKAVREP